MARKLNRKGWTALAVLGCLILLGIYFGWKAFKGKDEKAPQEQSSPTGRHGARVAPPEAAPSTTTTPAESFFPTPPAANDDTIVVCVNTWPGFAGAQVFNGGFEPNPNSRFTKEYGIRVRFQVEDDFNESRRKWRRGECHLVWQTIDALNTEASQLQDEGHAPKIFMQVDWSRKGDAVVVAPGITSVSDLRGKKIAVTLGTPSHTLFLRLLEAGGMKASDVVMVEASSAPIAAEMFQRREVQAAVVWSPDDETCLANVPGATILIDTGQATHVIADTLLVKKSYVDTHHDQLVKLTQGWLRGNAEINTEKSVKEEAIRIIADGYKIVIDGVDLFDRAAAAQAIEKVRFTTLGDNRSFFGLDSSTGMNGRRLFQESGALYRKNGFSELVPKVVPWDELADTSILEQVKLSGPEHRAEGEFQFEKPLMAEALEAPAISTKAVTITFPKNGWKLDENMKTLIDLQLGSIAASFKGFSFRIEGNTDNTGTPAVNLPLSKKRAQSVADFLIEKYGYDSDRFFITGNGSNKPVCIQNTETCREMNRRTEFEMIRLAEAMPE